MNFNRTDVQGILRIATESQEADISREDMVNAAEELGIPSNAIDVAIVKYQIEKLENTKRKQWPSRLFRWLFEYRRALDCDTSGFIKNRFTEIFVSAVVGSVFLPILFAIIYWVWKCVGYMITVAPLN
jgi:hypothetical protein